MKRFTLIFCIVLISCIKVKPSPFDTSQNPAVLVAEVVLTEPGTATGTGTSTGTVTSTGTGTATGTGTVIGTQFSSPPLKTGQTIVYATGDDGTYQSGLSRSYTDNGDGTITDNTTGLLWQKCSIGQTNNATCSGTSSSINWYATESTCSGLSLAGKTWRMPTKQELETLIDHGSFNPTLNTTAFPGSTSEVYWSSTTSTVPNTTSAWSVYYYFGYVNITTKSDSGRTVRCVSGPTLGSSGTFSDNGDGTVKDSVTGLVWQKCSRGQNNDSSCSGTATTSIWATAISDCNGLSLAGKSWRLPNMNELKTLVDITQTSSPSINTSAFPATLSDFYWSSTTDPTTTTGAFPVHFVNGAVAAFDKSTSYYIRCVSGP